MSTCIPIFGIPRTGTSLVASIVHALGCPMGSAFVQPPEDGWSPDHFWADAEFNAIHEKLLLNAGDVSYGMAVANPVHWTAYDALIQQREQLPLWGLKDVWLPILWPRIAPRISATVQPIFTTRPQAAIAASYKTRKGLDTAQAAIDILLPWAIATNKLRQLFPTALVVDFPTLVASPLLVVQAIAAYIGKPAKQAAADLVKPEWQRF